ncbi:MAG: YdcF family protein [Ginsengibacter sp.]
MVTDEIFSLGQILWDYHHMNQVPAICDCILALGSHDLRVAERAAELYHEGLAPLVIMSGGFGNFTKETWTESEADQFAAVAIQKGVPPATILVENRSTNTGENILFTQLLLIEKGLHPQSFIVVQKPYMERRAYATFTKHWPDKKLFVTSPQIPFHQYPTKDISLEKVINIMTGDLQRIKLYPAKGFQVYQEIPPEVWTAYEKLIQAGFNTHLAVE